MIEFTAWPKTPRLFRDMTITEKIDGTNAAVVVHDRFNLDNVVGLVHIDDTEAQGFCMVNVGRDVFIVGAQSRKRLITPQADNYGFARWVRENAAALAETLGTGVHFGEWWGSGIQRGYGLTGGEKRFSLFNVNRYAGLFADTDATGVGNAVPGLGVVPVLDVGPFNTERVSLVMNHLAQNGSSAAPGFLRPEGVVVFHEASRSVFKALIENDDQPKGDG